MASVCIKPYAVKMAAERLRGTGVAVGTVVGFPHGGSTTEVKLSKAIRGAAGRTLRGYAGPAQNSASTSGT